MTRVKICGCASYEDAALAIDAGADAVGFIFAPSERQMSIEAAATIASRLPPFAVIFGVFADPSPDEVREAQAAIPAIRLQFSGDEPPQLCESLANSAYLKAIHLGGPDGDDPQKIAQTAKYPRGIPLFDAWHPSKRGGTGITLAWSDLARATKPAPFAVSGGLTAENVAECIRRLKPNAVDVRSGVESGGRKDDKKVRAFVRAVREADAQA